MTYGAHIRVDRAVLALSQLFREPRQAVDPCLVDPVWLQELHVDTFHHFVARAEDQVQPRRYEQAPIDWDEGPACTPLTWGTSGPNR